MHHADQAIILRRIPYAEADQIVTFFSCEHGRMSGIAPSAKRSLRRFGSALEPGSIVSLTYRERGPMNLVGLESAAIAVRTFGITKTLERIAALNLALELALAFLPERQPAPEKFDLLSHYLQSLAQADPTENETLRFGFLWLKLSGYQPMLDRCCRCHRTIGQGVVTAEYFSLHDGGVVCGSCGAHGKDLIRFSMTRTLLARYTEYLLDRPLRSSELLSSWGIA